MLDAFLAAAYRASSEETEKRAFVENLKKLPNEELRKLASGETKLAHDHGQEWLDNYKGTPLFEQAVKLEQADIQNEVSRQQSQMAQPDSQAFYHTGDQIRLQKRLLDLELTQLEAQQAGIGGPAVPEAPAQGAGAPGMGAANNEEMMSPGPDTGMKTGAQGGTHGLPFDERGKTAAAKVPSLAERLVAGARAHAPAAKDLLGAIASGEGGSRAAALGRDAVRVGAGPMAEKAVGLGKEEGLGRLGQLLSGSRTKTLETLHKGTGGAKALAESEAFGHPFAASLAGKGHDALEKEIANERLSSNIARGVAGAGVAGAGLAAMAHDNTDDPNATLHQIRVASVKEADSWGRELARHDADRLTKEGTMLPTSLAGGLEGGLKSLTGTLGKANKATGGRLATGALMGSGLGALGGAVTGADKDEHGETHILRNMLGGAALGGAGGAVGGNVAHQMSKGKDFGDALKKGLTVSGQQATGAMRSARSGFDRGAVIQGFKDKLPSGAAMLAGAAPVVAGGAALATKYAPDIRAAASKAMAHIPSGAKPFVEGVQSAAHRAADAVSSASKTDLGQDLRGLAGKAHAALTNEDPNGVIASVHNLVNNARAGAAAAGIPAPKVVVPSGAIPAPAGV